MTGSVATISSDKLDERYTLNLLDNLEGRVAGLSTYGGKPIIRGVGTLSGSTAPLLVVDGLPIEGSLDDINPYDIEMCSRMHPHPLSMVRVLPTAL